MNYHDRKPLVGHSWDEPMKAGEDRVLTADELGVMFNVSSRTIRRWRQQGLAGRRFVTAGRTRLGFLESSVEQFVRRNQETPAESAFAEISGLDESAQETMYQQYCAGEPVSSLAKRFRCPEAPVRRVIEHRRVRRILELPLEYVPSPEFASRDAAQAILRPLPESARPRRPARPPAGLPRYIASLYEVPLLTPEEETYLFRKYNYLKFRAARLRRRLDSQRPAKRVMEEIESLYDEAMATKNQIIRANLRLVISVSKRYVTVEQQLCDLVSDGNESLMRAVEKFDYTRGFKFSTYAVWALKRNCVRSYSKEMKYRDRFRSGPEDLFDEAPEQRANLREQLGAQQRRETEVGRILHQLPDRERRIILSRFGLTPGQEPKTLQQVATEIGVSKERVRQLERRALGMLREVVAEQNLEFADIVSAAS